MKPRSIVLILGMAAGVICPASGQSAESAPPAGDAASRAAIEDRFAKSLHGTDAGRRHWYELPDGFGAVCELPFDDPALGCSGCHADGCDACHAPASGAGADFSLETARRSDTCLQCHFRQVEERRFAEERGFPDVHLEAGMACIDCHTLEEMHGDGRAQETMHAPENPSPTCTGCHSGERLDSYPHTVHGGKLACAACHVENTLACLNCHIDTVVREKTIEDNYLSTCDWTLLVNHHGQVTTGTALTLVTGGKKFLAYAPYFTHAVQPQGRDCGECHAARGGRRVRSEEPLPMAKFWEDALIPYNGVVPLKPDMLIWPYLEKEDGLWMYSTNPDTARIQLVGGCTPLDPQQIRYLTLPQRR
ncbi:MAG: hypothetical protein GF330_10950 [Candidatus Eisenbacteria bacterium]|nr:hypothetical protein [Candidatus Eisenbacteria bacterium]